MCYVFFLVPSCVRAVTRSFYGSLLLLMFCKTDSILPRTHVACSLSPLNPLNTLVSLVPVEYEVVMQIQLHHYITFHASVSLISVFKNLKGNINYPFKAVSHHWRSFENEVQVPVVNLTWGYIRSWKLVLREGMMRSGITLNSVL